MNTIITEKITFGGNCISKINGKTVFIPFAVPGEKLNVEIIESKKDYDIAKIVDILEPSKNRILSPCPYYGLCGGCNMMHIEPSAQKEYRVQILKDCFEQSDLSVDNIKIISGSNYNYRARFQLNNGGLSQKQSNKIIPITECFVAEDIINQYLKQTAVQSRPCGRAHLFGSKKVINPTSQISITQEQKEKEINFSNIKKKNKNIKQTKKRYSGTTISQETTITVKLLEKNISFDVRGFFQSNLEVLEKAVTAVCSDISGKNVLDMYAGCGTFSVFLADKFESVTLVEHNRDALVYAEQNLSGKKHESYGLSGSKWVQYVNENQKNNNFDAVVIDPPRSGMEKDVRDFLSKSKIPIIKSISCDPMTQARDISYLIKNGYSLKELYLLDFYPNTSHIESLAYLTYEN